MQPGRLVWILTTGVLLLTAGSLTYQDFIDRVAPPSADASEYCQPGELEEDPMYASLYEPTEEPRLKSYLNDTDRHQVPDYTWSVNRHGLREDPFRAEKPEGTLRILVVGSSPTLGVGLNMSERYTEKTEDRLEDRFSGDIQVINAGLEGTGMRDHYLYLYNEGMDLEPDIIVVPMKKLSEVSREEYDLMETRLRERYNYTGKYLRDHDKIWDRRQEWVHDQTLRGNWSNSDILGYGNMIRELGERNGSEVFFLTLRNPVKGHIADPVEVQGETYSSKIEAWEEVCGTRIVRAPKKLETDYLGTEWTFYRDRHYNADANTLLARSLSREIAEYLERDPGIARDKNSSR